MALPQPTIDVLARLDTETNGLADYVHELQAKISTSMTQEDVDTVNAGLGALADRLHGLAQNPANPVPAAAPLPPVSKKKP